MKKLLILSVCLLGLIACGNQRKQKVKRAFVDLYFKYELFQKPPPPLKPKDRNELNEIEDSHQEIIRKICENAVKRTEEQEREHHDLDITLVTHHAKIKFGRQKDKCDARAVERRNGNQIEYGKADIESRKTNEQEEKEIHDLDRRIIRLRRNTYVRG